MTTSSPTPRSRYSYEHGIIRDPAGRVMTAAEIVEIANRESYWSDEHEKDKAELASQLHKLQAEKALRSAVGDTRFTLQIDHRLIDCDASHKAATDALQMARIHGPDVRTIDALEETLARVKAAERDFIQVHKNCIEARARAEAAEAALKALRSASEPPEAREIREEALRSAGARPGSTHWDDCWRAHHGCAIAKIERELTAALVAQDVFKNAAVQSVVTNAALIGRMHEAVMDTEATGRPDGGLYDAWIELRNALDTATPSAEGRRPSSTRTTDK